MQKTILVLLVISIVLLNVIFISEGRFLGFYYIFWLGAVGMYVWKNRISIEQKLSSWNIGRFKKFILLGVFMILLEEIFAGISMHLGVTWTTLGFVIGILQFWALNIFALPGFIIGWYLLLSRIQYSRKEVFILVGIFGLWSEKVFIHVTENPIAGTLLILPTMFTYALIIAPSIMSLSIREIKKIPWVFRYILGLTVPFIVSIPFVGAVLYLRAHFPGVFPPF
jgi:hypothetical protein